MSATQKGKLYGVGLGAGDPELLTLKAVRLISSAAVIAYPAVENGGSLARSIAADHIRENAQEIVMSVPMKVERGPAQAAYDTGADAIRAALNAGDDVVVLCEGDPFFYGSFMYLFSRLKADFEIEVVPGVTSINACAAAAKLPLCARNDVVTILPAPELIANAERADIFATSDTIVVMKLGRHFAQVRALIDAAGLSEKTVYIERASTVDEVVLPLKDAPEKAPYFSMILTVKGADPWL